jgi:hypothetical protein
MLPALAKENRLEDALSVHLHTENAMLSDYVPRDGFTVKVHDVAIAIEVERDGCVINFFELSQKRVHRIIEVLRPVFVWSTLLEKFFHLFREVAHVELLFERCYLGLNPDVLRIAHDGLLDIVDKLFWADFV